MNVISRWNEAVIRDRAQYLRTGRNKGVRAAVAERKRTEAEARNAVTPPERRSRRTAASVTA